MKYTLFDASGRITMSGVMSPETLGLYANAGVQMLVGVAGDPDTQYVEALALVEYTEAERAALAALKPGWVWQMPEKVAVDVRELASLIARTVADVDRIADAARAAVVGDPVRVKEYERAQAQAEAFRDAGFTGSVPSCVACWAAAKEWTAQQAAEDILAASARWLGALDGIRALRLQAKEDIRRATTNAQVDTLLATFTATLTAAMQGVQ